MRRGQTRRRLLWTCAFASVVTAGACVTSYASGSASSLYLTRAAPNTKVWLAPSLEGGTAGWCMTIVTREAGGGSAGCGVPSVRRGPVVAESCGGDPSSRIVAVLTTSRVAKVSVEGGRPVATHTNATLPGGLRAAAVEVTRRVGRFKVEPCPAVRALSANGSAITTHRRLRSSFGLTLPGVRRWRAPHRPPSGYCKLTVSGRGPRFFPDWGNIATEMRPSRNLLGHPLVSCVDTMYFYREEDALDAAVLLDAEAPGRRPPGLPGMKRLPGHPGVVVAPGGSESPIVARRMPGAWLAVEGTGGIGLGVKVDLLERLRGHVATR